MFVRFRVAVACILGLLLVAGVASAIEDNVVLVRSAEWGSGDVTMRRGQVLTWKWESGQHTIMLGDPDKAADATEVATVDRDHPTATWDAKETGKFHFYSKQNPDIRLTVTVQANTGVDKRTWGWLKRLYEEGSTSRTRVR